MSRRVRGAFFAEYVRMIRHRRDLEWHEMLLPEDLVYLEAKVDEDAWYPMASFERLGLAILAKTEGATVEAARMWGHFSAKHSSDALPQLVAPDNPVESLMRLQVYRNTLFDFPAFEIPMLIDHQAHVNVGYHMCPRAEEAACYQTMGFCEGILSLAGASDVRGRFMMRSWAGDPATKLLLEWSAVE